jgi:hypothetical protein
MDEGEEQGAGNSKRIAEGPGYVISSENIVCEFLNLNILLIHNWN